MPLRDKILIIGHSGSGKSSLLRMLAELRPEYASLLQDLDQLILDARNYHLLSELIEGMGWERFRELERSILIDWIHHFGPGVLALGGGALDRGLLQSLREKPGMRLCFLAADFDSCWSRLLQDRAQPRPLMKLGKERFQALYQERDLVFQGVTWRIANGAASDLRRVGESFWEEVLTS